MYLDFIRERVTQLRLQKGVSEYKMSYDLGHSRGYINNISTGKTLPSMAEFFAICDYFCITPVDFFSDSVENPGATKLMMQDVAKLDEADQAMVIALVRRLLEK